MRKPAMRRLALFAVLAGALRPTGIPAEEVLGSPARESFTFDPMVLRDTASARESSWDQSGKNIDCRSVGPGETIDIARMEGAGCIRHIYFTIGPSAHYMNDLVLRAYWDGEETPSVEVPFGDFFGMRYDRVRFYQSSMVTINPGGNTHFGTVGFNSYFPMPFAKGARITLTNEGKDNIGAVWSHVDYEKLDRLPKGLGRFHAQWRREFLTTPANLEGEVNLDGKENYVILEAKGHGAVAGLFLHIDNVTGGWWGEGDDMIFIDGETWPPSFHGTGTEEIFGGGACPFTEYISPYTGWLYCGNKNFSFAGKNSVYRFYSNDPIRFRKSIRMTIEHGHANNQANDYSSTVFWYQDEPHAAFPPLLPVEQRYPRIGNDEHEQARGKFIELGRRLYYRTMWDGKPEALEAFVAIERAFDNRDNLLVIRECDKWLAKAPKIPTPAPGRTRPRR